MANASEASKILTKYDVIIRSFRFVAANTWNKLPLKIRSANTLETFRGLLKSQLYDLLYSN